MFKPKLLPTLIVLPLMITLVCLGNWQIERLHWKEALQKKIQERRSAEPIMLPNIVNNVDSLEFRRVMVSGQFHHELELYLVSRTFRGNVGINIVTPFMRIDNKKYLFINRGWAPLNYKGRKIPHINNNGEVQTVTGTFKVIRKRRPFLPENEPQNNTWFYIDPSAMAESRGLRECEEYYISIDPSQQHTYPTGASFVKNLYNHHLIYAVTWYSLSVALLLTYIFASRSSRD